MNMCKIFGIIGYVSATAAAFVLTGAFGDWAMHAHWLPGSLAFVSAVNGFISHQMGCKDAPEPKVEEK